MELNKSMTRSISMPVKPNYLEPNVLQRCNEKEHLYTEEEEYEYDGDGIELEYLDTSDNNLINGNEDDILPDMNNEHISSLKYYTRDNNRRRQSENFYGSTIEVHDDTSAKIDEFEKKKKDLFDKTLKSRINLSKRLISKNGHQNVSFKKIPHKSIHFLKDLVTTLVEQSWGYTITLFVFIFIGSWLGFAVLWYLIAQAHGDFNFDAITGERLGDGKQPCVHGVYDFLSIFIHSMETQTTIGFGEKYPTEECPEGVILFVIQIIMSIGFEGAMVAIVYAKMARPVKNIYSKLTFSKTACICVRDDQYCFVFRVCDEFEQKSISTKIRAYLVNDVKTPEGETIKIHTELTLKGNGTPMIMWPETVCHAINKDSPFYEFTPDDFRLKQYEIFVSLVGHSQTTGQLTESLTSYLPQEIAWGQRFVNIILYNRSKGSFVIDYKNFHTTEMVKMPSGSASDLEQQEQLDQHQPSTSKS